MLKLAHTLRHFNIPKFVRTFATKTDRVVLDNPYTGETIAEVPFLSKE